MNNRLKMIAMLKYTMRKNPRQAPKIGSLNVLVLTVLTVLTVVRILTIVRISPSRMKLTRVVCYSVKIIVSAIAKHYNIYT